MNTKIIFSVLLVAVGALLTRLYVRHGRYSAAEP